MPHTGYDASGDEVRDAMPLQRYAVVSCHVERVLDDAAWEAFRRFQARRPGGFRIAALVRPPDPASDEGGGPGQARDARWAERAQALAAQAPFGLHTHYGGRSNGRARAGDPEPAARVREELAYVAAAGLEPRFFCGGNWYIDADVAAVLASAGVADCSATAFAPGHLAADAQRLALAAPARLTLGGATPSSDLLELPTTHSLGMTCRAAVSPRLPAVLHCYFHDYDLLVPARARALAVALAVLGRRGCASDLEQLRAAVESSGGAARPRPFLAAAAPGGADRPAR